MLNSVLPLSVGLPVNDHLLLRWVVDVADLHQVLMSWFFSWQHRPPVLFQAILEVVPDVHSLLPGRPCAVLWPELLWQENRHLWRSGWLSV
jgi:hypothetical protein